ncbi:unnamed protein product [Parascedosporium putredinis]|uniref:Amidase domain-containing protein n=1 Tax=Parascedosporium putredinis TaxID=1442378 RepID=A0A9P1GY89_9PEZI|nr:unnamed protein product [Parascedosporium putredinis]CAI7989707.1 unnamed protein product [Parascedosporium putredinis]
MSSNTESWQAKAQRKRDQILQGIPEQWRLSRADLDRAALQSDLTGSFIQSFLDQETIEITSLETNEINPCLHELFIEYALDRAKELDAFFEKHGKPTGALHGLPISLKDQFHVGDFDTTMAYVGWIDGKLGIDKEKSPVFESDLVKELRSLGAVFYCKTALPQTVLVGFPYGHLNGRSQGLTFISLLAWRNNQQHHWRLELVFRSVLSTKPWLSDPAVVPIPWRTEELESIRSRVNAKGQSAGRPLKFGFFWRNSTLEPHPPVRRGLKIVAEALQRAGHIIVDWNPPDHKVAEHIHAQFLYADGAHDVQAHISRSGEPIIPNLKSRFGLREPMPLLQYQDLTMQGLDFENRYADYWNSTGTEDGHAVDAFIMAPAPHAAVIPGKYLTPGYTEVINLLNYSAVALPVTRADKALDVVDTDYIPSEGLDKRNWDAYEPDIYHGAPVGVQVVARKFEEEKALAIAEVVQAAIRAAQT